MDLTALGTSGAWPGAGRAASGYLLRHDGFRVALDLGTGTLSRLQQLIDLKDLDGIVISHAHYDHFLDLYPLFVARFFHPEELPPIPVLAPNGFFDYFCRLTEDEGKDMPSVFECRELGFGQETDLGPFRIRTWEMTHLVPTIGVRLQADGTSVAYTGDTGPTDEVEALARGTDLLLSEAALQDMNEPPWFHLTARQAGEYARRAEVPSLVLSHFWPTADRDLSREQAAEVYQGDQTMFEEGDTVEVGS